ncbi:MAG: ABC transporter permease [Planctomycetes bacterium]|nr:ABC transporter permease [Planctomycetota bacterium]
MRTYIIKRLLLVIPTLLIITFVCYALMRVAPGDPVKAHFLSQGEGASTLREGEGLSKAGELFRKRFHLDKPVVVGYGYWLWGIVRHGDFGVSVTVNLGTPVWELIVERVPTTFKLNLWATALVFLIAVPIGVFSAVKRGSLLDRATTLLLFIFYSLPSFWVGLMLLIAASKWMPGWPTSGLSPRTTEYMPYWAILGETTKHYVLPVFCLSYAGLAGLSRYARVGLLEVIRQDYIRTARAKGCGEWRVIFVHALRNGLIPIIVIMAGLIPGLIGGSIIIEYLFEIQGMGDLSLTALSSRDYPVLMTLFGISALLTLVGLLASDIALTLVDPRISYERKT